MSLRRYLRSLGLNTSPPLHTTVIRTDRLNAIIKPSSHVLVVMLSSTDMTGTYFYTVNVRLQYQIVQHNGNDSVCLGHSRQPHGPIKFLTTTALPTDANAETLQKVLSLQLLSQIAKMLYDADNQAEVAHQRLKRHHEAQLQKETHFYVGQLEFLNRPQLLTSAADKRTVGSYSKLLLRAHELCFVKSTTLYTINIDQDGIPNTISVNWVSPAPTPLQL